MNRKFCFVFFAILSITSNLFSDELPSSANSVVDERLLADLEVARQTWLDTVSLYGHYTFRKAYFSSEEEAESSEIDDNQVVAKGILCKKRDKCRLQVSYENDRSSDSIINRDYRILYHPTQGKSFASDGYLTKVENDDISASILELNYFKTPFALFLEPDDFRNVTIDSKPLYSDLGEGRVKILFSGKDQAGYQSTKEVIFRTNSKVPVIESIVMRFYLNNKTLTSKITALDWKEFNGLEIPTRIRSMVGPLRPANIDSDVWSTSEWKSEDLNIREPEDSDFILRLNKNEKLAGMRFIPQNGLVDLDQITDDDLLGPGDVDYLVYESGETPDKHRGFARWIRLSLSFVAVALILVFFITRKRNKD